MDRPDAWYGWKELMDGWTGRDGNINGGGAYIILLISCFLLGVSSFNLGWERSCYLF